MGIYNVRGRGTARVVVGAGAYKPQAQLQSVIISLSPTTRLSPIPGQRRRSSPSFLYLILASSLLDTPEDTNGSRHGRHQRGPQQHVPEYSSELGIGKGGAATKRGRAAHWRGGVEIRQVRA